jgi:hypothetical protein
MNSTIVTIESISKVASIFIAALAFTWGVWQYFRSEREKREQRRSERERDAHHRRIEATQPFLERQLSFYLEATRVAAIIAVSREENAVCLATHRFKELFWGELAMVEDERVEIAMLAFKSALDDGLPAIELEQMSLGLAHACRDSLARSWGTAMWRSHYRRDPQPRADARDTPAARQ